MAGLWLASGHHRNGVLLAPVTAELLAAAICPAHGEAHGQQKTNSPVDRELLAAFRWDRF
jgi:glycine oxidase